MCPLALFRVAKDFYTTVQYITLQMSAYTTVVIQCVYIYIYIDY